MSTAEREGQRAQEGGAAGEGELTTPAARAPPAKNLVKKDIPEVEYRRCETSSERAKSKSETRRPLFFLQPISRLQLAQSLRQLDMATQQTPDFASGVAYWANTDASVNGVLGGFGQ